MKIVIMWAVCVGCIIGNAGGALTENIDNGRALERIVTVVIFSGFCTAAFLLEGKDK